MSGVQEYDPYQGLELIAEPGLVSAPWLTRLLSLDHPDSPAVTGFEAERVGTGQVGQCVRFLLRFESPPPPDVPTSLVGKFASPDPESRAAGVEQQCYLKEVHFFRELAADLAVRTPRCYFAAIDGEGPDFTLMLEDLAPARQGDQIQGCTPEVAHAAVRELAGLHAPLWGSSRLATLRWLDTHDQERLAASKALYSQVLPGFIERYASRLTSDALEVCRAIAASDRLFRRDLATLPPTVVHGDYRLDNLLTTSDDPPLVSVVDWQTVSCGQAGSDLAYFIGAAMPAAARRPIENALLLTYTDALRQGHLRFATEDLIADYRLGTFAGLIMAVIASMIVGRTERGDDMFMAMAQRHADHAQDWKALELS